MTKAEIEKIREESAEKYCDGWSLIPSNSLTDSVKRSLIKSEDDFK